MKRLKDLELENSRLRKADLTPNKLILQEAAARVAVSNGSLFLRLTHDLLTAFKDRFLPKIEENAVEITVTDLPHA